MSDRDRRHVSKAERRRYLAPPEDSWVPFAGSMLASPAWRAMSRPAFLIFSRLAVEHLARGGNENGRLAVSFDEFERAGVDRHAIKPSIVELEALGFIRVTAKGRRAYGCDPGRIASYRLTVVGVVQADNAGPSTNDWRHVTEEEAARIADQTRSAKRRKKVAGPIATVTTPPPLRLVS